MDKINKLNEKRYLLIDEVKKGINSCKNKETTKKHFNELLKVTDQLINEYQDLAVEIAYRNNPKNPKNK